MERRELLIGLGFVAVPIAGCTTDSRPVSITVQNFSNETFDVDVKVRADEEFAFEESVRIPANEKRHWEDVVDGSNHTLVVSADEFEDISRPIPMNECRAQEVSVAILPSKRLEVQLKRC